MTLRLLAGLVAQGAQGLLIEVAKGLKGGRHD